MRDKELIVAIALAVPAAAFILFVTAFFLWLTMVFCSLIYDEIVERKTK